MNDADYLFAIAGLPIQGNEALYIEVSTVLVETRPKEPVPNYHSQSAYLVSELVALKNGEIDKIEPDESKKEPPVTGPPEDGPELVVPPPYNRPASGSNRQ